MNDAVKEMLKQFGKIESPQDELLALREILQKIILLALHREGFFEKSAFYGGTALRLLYGLNRFSEDMDFCLLEADESFVLVPYFESIREELERFGFSAEVTSKRTGPGAEIESAFVKQPTQVGLISIGRTQSQVNPDQLVKIRLEVDKHNPPGGVSENRLVKLPVPFLVKSLDLPSLFAGKLHAILARSYLNRVKGRDYYDLQFYLARSVPVRLTYLEAKLRDSGHYSGDSPLTRDKAAGLLKTKFHSVDFKKAIDDVSPFLLAQDQSQIYQWSADLFCCLVDDLKAT